MRDAVRGLTLPTTAANRAISDFQREIEAFAQGPLTIPLNFGRLRRQSIIPTRVRVEPIQTRVVANFRRGISTNTIVYFFSANDGFKLYDEDGVLIVAVPLADTIGDIALGCAVNYECDMRSISDPNNAAMARFRLSLQVTGHHARVREVYRCYPHDIGNLIAALPSV